MTGALLNVPVSWLLLETVQVSYYRELPFTLLVRATLPSPQFIALFVFCFVIYLLTILFCLTEEFSSTV
jgi:hypothetical protein